MDEPTKRPLRASFFIPESATGKFLDQVLFAHAGCFPTRSSAKKSIKREEILVDGLVASATDRIRPGQRVEVLLTQRTAPRPYEMGIEVLYEDDWLAVVYKPAGLVTNGNSWRTLENTLPHCLKRSTRDDVLPWPAVAHRLDRGTQGPVAVGKCQQGLISLNRAFENRQVHKQYRAIVMGQLTGQGEVNTPLDGRECLTRWSAEQVSRSVHGDGWLTTVSLEPYTGRMHQLRRHLAELGHPILGDALYGTPGRILKKSGIYLAAVTLDLPHPSGTGRVQVTCPEPAKFEARRQREARRFAVKNHDAT